MPSIEVDEEALDRLDDFVDDVDTEYDSYSALIKDIFPPAGQGEGAGGVGFEAELLAELEDLETGDPLADEHGTTAGDDRATSFEGLDDSE